MKRLMESSFARFIAGVLMACSIIGLLAGAIGVWVAVKERFYDEGIEGQYRSISEGYADKAIERYRKNLMGDLSGTANDLSEEACNASIHVSVLGGKSWTNYVISEDSVAYTLDTEREIDKVQSTKQFEYKLSQVTLLKMAGYRRIVFSEYAPKEGIYNENLATVYVKKVGDHYEIKYTKSSESRVIRLYYADKEESATTIQTEITTQTEETTETGVVVLNPDGAFNIIYENEYWSGKNDDSYENEYLFSGTLYVLNGDGSLERIEGSDPERYDRLFGYDENGCLYIVRDGIAYSDANYAIKGGEDMYGTLIEEKYGLVNIPLSTIAEYRKLYDETLGLRDTYYDKTSCTATYDGTRIITTLRFADIKKAKITVKVKKEFAAADDYYYSGVIRYGSFVFGAAAPLLVISAILFVLLLWFIPTAAGRRKGGEGLCLRGFDRIPLDLCFLLWLVIPFVSYCLIQVRQAKDEAVIMAVSVMAVLFPPFLYTTSARIKLSGVSCLKNTVLYRLAVLAMKLLGNFKLYARYEAIWLGVRIAEFLFLRRIISNNYRLLMVFVADTVVFGLAIAWFSVYMYKVKKGAERLASGELSNKIDTNHMPDELKKHAEQLNSIGDGIALAVEERMKSERMKTELITNVSHDIKTPLTSIINYVDLLKKEKVEGERANEYIGVIERQSARLKKLIQDLIDASKASSGSIELNPKSTDISVLLTQATAEFTDRLEEKGLKLVRTDGEGDFTAFCDGRLVWRIVDNLLSNIVKYAVEDSRVYVELSREGESVKVLFKNVSNDELNISGDELMERFVRGDSSRNTEGSGLGLSIAKSLAELNGGELDISIDGDLFKACLSLPIVEG